MTQHLPILYQFRLSMFPEKVRWALDYKNIPHIRHNMLPGPHIPQVLKLTNKQQTCTPLLQTEEGLLTNSNQILAWLENRYPNPALFPTDPTLKAEVDAEITRFDEWGPHTRRALFHAFLPHTRYAASAFAQGTRTLKRAAYTAVFPGVRIAMRKAMDINDEQAARSNEVVKQALDYLATNTARTGYLVGDQFTAADLTAATCMHCVAHPAEFPARFPEPRAKGHEDWMARWGDHPATQWVRHIYSAHRPASVAIKNID